jgi:hypothetical protein
LISLTLSFRYLRWYEQHSNGEKKWWCDQNFSTLWVGSCYNTIMERKSNDVIRTVLQHNNGEKKWWCDQNLSTLWVGNCYNWYSVITSR